MAELLFNGRFTRFDGREVEALVVDGPRIVFAGARRGADACAAGAGAEPRRHDLEGRCVIPGLIDMHAHLDREGLKLNFPAMAGLRSRGDVLARIAELARAAAPGEWVVTMPVGEPPFYFFASPEEESALYPTRHELDEAAPDNPVYIRPILGFWRWSPLPETLVSTANSAALAAVGIGDLTPPPSPSVHLERDAAGRLTGRFFERTAASILELLYFSRAVRFAPDDRVAGLRAAQAIALARGVTTVFEGHGCEEAVIAAYTALHRDRALAIRAELAFSPSWKDHGDAPPAETVTERYGWLAGAGRGDDQLRLRGLFLNPHVAPDDRARAAAGGYTGMAGYYFDSGLDADQARGVTAAAARLGLRCVGLSPALFPLFDTTTGDLGGLGWTVQHCGRLLAEHEAIARRRGLRLTFLPVEAIYKQGPLARSHAKHLREWMPLRRLIDSGQPLSLATDNIPPSLFFALWCCLARRDRHGGVTPDPDGDISRLEALRLATLGAAECLGRADTLGSLDAGKYADLAVLDRDYFSCPLDDIPAVRSEATMVNGIWHHASAAAPASIRAAAHQTEGAHPC